MKNFKIINPIKIMVFFVIRPDYKITAYRHAKPEVQPGLSKHLDLWHFLLLGELIDVRY